MAVLQCCGGSADPLRWFMAAEVPFGSDGDFSIQAFVNRANSALSNQLGNLAMRSLSLAFKQYNGHLPRRPTGALQSEDTELLQLCAESLSLIRPLMLQTTQLHLACEQLTKVASAANKYIDTQAPWALKKTDEARMEVVLYVLCEAIRQLAILQQPFVPTGASAILSQLGVPDTPAQRSFGALTVGEAQLFGPHALEGGTAISKPVVVFQRLDKTVVEQALAPAAL